MVELYIYLIQLLTGKGKLCFPKTWVVSAELCIHQVQLLTGERKRLPPPNVVNCGGAVYLTRSTVSWQAETRFFNNQPTWAVLCT